MSKTQLHERSLEILMIERDYGRHAASCYLNHLVCAHYCLNKARQATENAAHARWLAWAGFNRREAMRVLGGKSVLTIP